MTILTLVRRNLIHFWQINLAVVAGVTVAVAVLAARCSSGRRCGPACAVWRSSGWARLTKW